MAGFFFYFNTYQKLVPIIQYQVHISFRRLGVTPFITRTIDPFQKMFIKRIGYFSTSLDIFVLLTGRFPTNNDESRW
jgi:hypothetical protein